MTTAQDVLRAAAGEVGVRETPAGSNRVKYNTAYYGREVSGSAYPWCCAFVWWVFCQVGARELITKTASCTAMLNHLKGRGGLVETAQMRPGDLVFYNWSKGPKGSVANHIGIVEQVGSGGGFTAIEGNTAVGNEDNGGAVMRRSRRTDVVLAVARPRYGEEENDMEEKNRPAQWAKEAWDRAAARGVLDGARPAEALTRQELAVVLDRLGLLKGGG